MNYVLLGMNFALIVLGIAFLVFVVFAMWVMGVYNSLVKLRNRFENAFSQIDVQLKRRFDLIPNLVNVVKGYMAHEKETLEAVIQARSAAMNAASAAAANPGDAVSMGNLSNADSQLNGALGRLMMVAESYPDLKANENMLALQEELTSTENKVSFARQSYNDAVTNYNTQRELFPSNTIAGMFNFGPAELFAVEEKAERDAPKVEF